MDGGIEALLANHANVVEAQRQRAQELMEKLRAVGNQHMISQNQRSAKGSTTHQRSVFDEVKTFPNHTNASNNGATACVYGKREHTGPDVSRKPAAQPIAFESKFLDSVAEEFDDEAYSTDSMEDDDDELHFEQLSAPPPVPKVQPTAAALKAQQILEAYALKHTESSDRPRNSVPESTSHDGQSAPVQEQKHMKLSLVWMKSLFRAQDRLKTGCVHGTLAPDSRNLFSFVH